MVPCVWFGEEQNDARRVNGHDPWHRRQHLHTEQVREFFPAARDANLVKSTVIKEVNATYSPRPGIDAHRPTPVTPWPRVFLAGDWTATGWPATMEGAVRSGYLAAEALADVSGNKGMRFLTPDMPASGLMRLFVK